jgi:hypothetical protein
MKEAIFNKMAFDQFLRTHGYLGDCYDNLTYAEALKEHHQQFKPNKFIRTFSRRL